MADNKRAFDRANDWNNNIGRDYKGVINRENKRRYVENKEETIGIIIGSIIIIYIAYKIWMFITS